MILVKINLSFLLSLYAIAFFAQHSHHPGDDPNMVFAHFESNSPIGVSGDHYHMQNSFMLTYKYINMRMKNMIQGSEDISLMQVHENYMVSPKEMTMGMHMLGAMYAFSDRITVMGMIHHMDNAMELQMRNNNQFSSSSTGIGDLDIAAIYALHSSRKYSWHILLGLTIPTGEYELVDDTPMSENVVLAYPMQIGSGTWDPYFGSTFLMNTGKFCSGVQGKIKFRTGENSAGYSLGTQFDASLWTSYAVNQTFSFTGRLIYNKNGKISGSNSVYNTALMPLFDANNSGNSALALNAGVNAKIPITTSQGIQFGIEAGMPFHQEVEGIQMKKDWMLIAGLKYTLGSHKGH